MRPHVRSCVVFLIAFMTQGATARQTQITWPTSNSHSIQVTLVFGDPLQNSIPLLTEKTKQALSLAQKRQGLSLREDFYIYFDVEPDEHNGLATIVPNNRIYVQTEPPFVEESIGFASDYLLETLTHEIGHMIPLQQRGGLFTALGAVFGNTSCPVGLWPRWIHEGFAVWTEAATGGRPASGYIHYQLRQYAEYFHRENKHPLHSYDLDGSDPDYTPLGFRGRHSRVEPGEFPYHFGYLLLHDWQRQSPPSETAFPRFVTASSKSLGSSFRINFRKEGASINEVFRSSREKWAATPIPSDAFRAKEIWGEADVIQGPFSNSQALTWIEGKAGSHVRNLRARNLKSTDITTKWDYRRSHPLQAYRTENSDWLLLVRRPDVRPTRPSGRRVWRVSHKGRKVCELETPLRLREIDLQGSVLTWTRSLRSGEVLLEQAELTGTCTISAIREIARSRIPFERLSAPRYVPETGATTFSRSVGRGSFHEHMEILAPDQTTILKFDDKDIAALSQPSPLASSNCQKKARLCWLANEFSPEHWGPVILEELSTGWTSRRLPLSSGSARSAPVPNSLLIAVREQRWEKDRIIVLSHEDFKGVGRKILTGATSLPSEDTLAAPDTQASHAWPSIWPHFWIPSLAAAPGGTIVMGQTFYEDLARNWKGSTEAGYDSSLSKPFASTTLTRQRLLWGPITEANVSLNYSPIYNYLAALNESPAQDRWGASSYLRWSHLLPNEWLLAFKTQLEFLYSARTQILISSKNVIPSFFWNLSSTSGVPLHEIKPVHDLNEFAGFYATHQIGWVKKPFHLQGFRGNIPVGKTALTGVFQYGLTSPQNFPAKAFEWGGLPEFSSPKGAEFPSRGFRPRFMAAKEIVRASAEWQYAWTRPHSAVSWNRARVSSLESRWIIESVSFSQIQKPFPGNVEYKMGRQYFTSAGATLDFWGSALHYINFVASLGAFRGFGSLGETRLSLVMQGWLEL